MFSDRAQSFDREFLKRLREETQAAHLAVEQAVRIEDRIKDKANYIALLKKFYGFYKQLEPLLQTSSVLAALPLAMERRQKLLWLKQDLLALGMTLCEINDVPACDCLPAMNTTEQALGSLYVLEGSSLGGQIISRMLSSELQVGFENGGRYFHGYGTETGQLWRQYGDIVATYAVTERQQQAIVAAANDMFDCFKRWVQ